MKQETKKKYGEWLLDVAKYLLIAVLISSFFKDFANKWIVYIGGTIAVAISFYIGIRMFDKNNKNKQNYRYGSYFNVFTCNLYRIDWRMDKLA